MPQATTVEPLTSDHDVAASPMTRIGDWRLVQLLKVGGWSQVYQAAPVGCTSRTADYVLKTWHSRLGSRELAREMLWREAVIGSTVSHPNLSALLAWRFKRDPCYIVMPYVRGASLDEVLAAAGQLSTPHALWIARQVASAIGELHQAGWMHGDIKPANIHVATNGHATLLDLGLACGLPYSRETGRSFAGTPAYAAPEWFSPSAAPGPWSDVYNLGVTLFEMLTGRVPAAAGDADGHAAARRRVVPEARRLAPGVPSSVDKLLRRMLATEPLRRPIASELVNQLFSLEIETLDQRAPIA